MQAYRNSREHIFDVLLLLYLRLKSRVEREKAERPQGGHNEYSGLVLSEEEILSLLQSWAGGEMLPGQGTQPRSLSEVNKLEGEIAARLNGSLEQGVRLSLHEVESRFGLTPFDSSVLVMCLAPELDLRYERLYAYLQNDVTSKRPTVDLAFRLFCETMDERVQARARFTGQSPLFKHLLLSFNGEDHGSQSFLSRPLKLDERMVRFLLEIDAPDEAIASFSRAVSPSASLTEVMLPPEEKAALVRLFTSVVRGEGGVRVLVFHGPADVGKKYAAEALCGSIERSLIVANMALLPSHGPAAASLMARLFREAQLRDASVYLDSASVLMAEQEQARHIRWALMQAVETFQGVTFIGSTRPWNTSTLEEAQSMVNVEFPWPDFDARRRLWRALINRSSSLCAMPESEIETIADKFRFTAGKIQQSVAEADHRARMRQQPSPEALTQEMYRACRSQSTTKLAELAQKIKPLYTWDDIVLSKDTLQHLREICLHVRHRRRVFTDWNFDKRVSLGKGTSALFSGPSGTGKTMAAEIIANDLGLDLYKIDLSTVVSKYIGETEKNLSRIFQEAEQSNAILFFDEADALFGKRSEVKDAHDRYANIEINYLLQKMEEYEGIVIMASNFQKNIDEAFTRRLRFIIEIPFPDRNYRARIWRNIFPAETPRAKDIAFDFLAGKFEISGGNIKNIALNAAFQAAENSGVVSMKHIVRATRREFQKMGRMFVKSDFGEYYNLLEND
ncbi:MAG TPA: AAA family ATPase [Pyrinomonadaceae bacterium]|jgi:SpoVK/Ycf46/Vps4 family AAA+-type ATPase|nr:AAA family ATPase [Pyrinomonadaceae bacterium]